MQVDWEAIFKNENRYVKALELWAFFKNLSTDAYYIFNIHFILKKNMKKYSP